MITGLVTYLLLTVVGFLDDYLKVVKKNSKGLAGRQIDRAVFNHCNRVIFIARAFQPEPVRV